MINKKLMHELRLPANDLNTYPFSSITSIGHMERTTGYTQEPLQLSIQLKYGNSPTPLLPMYAVIDLTNYNI